MLLNAVDSLVDIDLLLLGLSAPTRNVFDLFANATLLAEEVVDLASRTGAVCEPKLGVSVDGSMLGASLAGVLFADSLTWSMLIVDVCSVMLVVWARGIGLGFTRLPFLTFPTRFLFEGLVPFYCSLRGDVCSVTEVSEQFRISGS